MNSFFKLIRKPEFSLSLIAGLAISSWNLVYGNQLIGIIFLLLILTSIVVNVYKTK